MKKIFIILLALGLFLLTVGCQKAPENTEVDLNSEATEENSDTTAKPSVEEPVIPTSYKLITEEIRTELIDEPEESYSPGETVTLTVGTVTETNQYLWVNDQKINPTQSNLMHTVFTFTMPDCDAIVRLEQESVDIPLPPEKEESSDAINTTVTDFALRLFKESIAEDKSTLISPLSVLTALSMTANGAAGETLSQIENVLGASTDELNLWISQYQKSLPNNLKMANSIWFKDADSFTVNDDFLRTNTDYYGAGVFEAPFDDSTLKEINEWVENNTDKMIKDILDKISRDAVMYLVNALAFDAEWQEIYYERQIRDGQFTTENGTKRQVELMYSSENQYLEDQNATGFIKNYKGGKFAFAALLPNEGVSVLEYVASLDGRHLSQLLANAKQNVVSAAIPKFDSEYKVEMKDILVNMGMPDAFNYTLADFSKMGKSTEGNLLINRVIHQSYINVDAKGTKAGAATVVEIDAPTSEMTDFEPPKEVFLDRPFVYMLIDCENDLPFFIGTVMDVE